MPRTFTAGKLAVVAIVVAVSAGAGTAVAKAFVVEAHRIKEAVITPIALGNTATAFVFVFASVGKEEVGYHTIFGKCLANAGVAHFAASNANVPAGTADSVAHTAAYIEGKATGKRQHKYRRDQEDKY